MKLRLTILAITLAGCLPPLTNAQVMRTIDLKKEADVNGKNVNYSDLQFSTISQPAHEVSKAPIAQDGLKLQGVELNNMDLKTLDMSSVSTPVLSKPDFKTKQAVVEKLNYQTTNQLSQAKQKAPVTDRQIRPFAPGGEEELKKQLNDPH